MAKSSWQCPEFKNRRQVGDLEKKIHLLKQKSGFSVFSIAGCRGGEGVSTIVVNLINYLAKSEGGKNVLLLDASLKRPVLHDAMDQSAGQGLSDILKGTTAWSDAVSSTISGNVHFIGSGANAQQMAGNIELEKMANVMGEVRKMYDYVLIDSPPVLTSADSLTLAGVSDATFLVVRSLETPKEVGGRAKSLLLDNECVVGGVLLNRVKQVVPGWMYRLF